MNTEQRPFCLDNDEDLLECLYGYQENLSFATEELKKMRSMGIRSNKWKVVKSLERIQSKSIKNISLIKDEIEIRKQINVLVVRLDLLIMHGNNIIKRRR